MTLLFAIAFEFCFAVSVSELFMNETDTSKLNAMYVERMATLRSKFMQCLFSCGFARGVTLRA